MDLIWNGTIKEDFSSNQLSPDHAKYGSHQYIKGNSRSVMRSGDGVGGVTHLRCYLSSKLQNLLKLRKTASKQCYYSPLTHLMQIYLEFLVPNFIKKSADVCIR